MVPYIARILYCPLAFTILFSLSIQPVHFNGCSDCCFLTIPYFIYSKQAISSMPSLSCSCPGLHPSCFLWLLQADGAGNSKLCSKLWSRKNLKTQTPRCSLRQEGIWCLHFDYYAATSSNQMHFWESGNLVQHFRASYVTKKPTLPFFASCVVK